MFNPELVPERQRKQLSSRVLTVLERTNNRLAGSAFLLVLAMLTGALLAGLPEEAVGAPLVPMGVFVTVTAAGSLTILFPSLVAEWWARRHPMSVASEPSRPQRLLSVLLVIVSWVVPLVFVTSSLYVYAALLCGLYPLLKFVSDSVLHASMAKFSHLQDEMVMEMMTEARTDGVLLDDTVEMPRVAD